MKTAAVFAAAIILASVSSAIAEDLPQKMCTLGAISKLQQMISSSILSTSTKYEYQSNGYVINIRISVADIKATYRFICQSNSAPMAVQFVGIVE